MTKKSIVIICKGPSALKSSKEFIESFDEVAICNFPPMRGYEEYVGNKADYHFFNAHDPRPYDKELLDSLGLKEIFNTHNVPHKGFPSSFPDHPHIYYPNYGRDVVEKFESEYDFHPSTGIQAFYYFVTNPNFDRIAVVGFDFFKVGQKAYYFSPKEVQPSLKYLFNDNGSGPYLKDGTRVKESLHDTKKSEKFVSDMIKLHNKKLIKLT